MRGLPQKQNARRAYKIRLYGHLRRYKKIVKKTYIISMKYYDVPVEIKQKNIIKNIAPNMFDQDLIDIFRFEIKKTLKTQNSYSNLYLFDKIIEDNMNEIY